MANTQFDHRFGIDKTKRLILGGCILLCLGAFLLRMTIIEGRPVPMLGIFLLVIGIIGCTIREGILIDPVENWYKYYFRLGFINLGVRKKLDTYQDILCLRYKKKVSRYTENQGEIERDAGVQYEVYLASPNHFDMILVHTSKSNIEAEEKAHILGQDLGMEWVQYNPGGRRPRKVLGGSRVQVPISDV